MITHGHGVAACDLPVYLLLSGKPSGTVIVLAVLLLGSLKALYLGASAALMSELFPASTRATGLGLSYNIGVTAFGGSGPAIVTWLGSFALIGDLAPGLLSDGGVPVQPLGADHHPCDQLRTRHSLSDPTKV